MQRWNHVRFSSHILMVELRYILTTHVSLRCNGWNHVIVSLHILMVELRYILPLLYTLCCDATATINYSGSLNMYRSSQSTSKAVRNCLYSSRKFFLRWCISWFCMYLITVSTWLLAYENAPYPFCQEKCESQKPLSLTQAQLSVFTRCINDDMDCSGSNPINICIWSGMLFICSILCLLFWTMPVIYRCSLSCHVGAITAFLNLTVMTHWMWIWV